MKKKILKKIFLDKKIIIASLGNLGKWIHTPSLWVLNSESIARGVAIGFFTACVPIMPFQTLLTISLSLLFKANFAIAFTVSWISNPLTLIPLTYYTYRLGEWVLGDHQMIIIQKFHWRLDHTFWINVAATLHQFGKAFFVGLPMIAFGSAAISYFLMVLISRIITIFKRKHTFKSHTVRISLKGQDRYGNCRKPISSSAQK